MLKGIQAGDLKQLSDDFSREMYNTARINGVHVPERIHFQVFVFPSPSQGVIQSLFIDCDKERGFLDCRRTFGRNSTKDKVFTPTVLLEPCAL